METVIDPEDTVDFGNRQNREKTIEGVLIHVKMNAVKRGYRVGYAYPIGRVGE